ncbi:MAG: hypothetical protein UW70_C0028G0003 [Candidatus Peregrinibacteria bacterium GW2011_GWA2_44_7]|nr:MAG: hypothetical protein UW70_C0028G0003 [Candidatus Peregrinibacteria bacterium GW2011_GWA2_44_7]
MNEFEFLEEIAADDPVVLGHAERIISGIVDSLQGDFNTKVQSVMNSVFEDPEILKQFNGGIRYTTMVGSVVNRILDALPLGERRMSLLTIGTILPPDFVLPVMERIDSLAAEIKIQIGRIRKGRPYDVSAQGLLPPRKAAIGLFDEHYHFSDEPELEEKLSNNSVLVSGGMVGLDFFVRSMLKRAKKAGKTALFVYPDNSFDSYKKIVADHMEGGRAKHSEISTEPENGLHLSAKNVREFYEKNPENDQKVWCITPVGNPSGTKMTPDQLTEVCEAIVECDPEAIILLDSTYIRVLDPKDARALVARVIRNRTVMNRIIFLESFSKTHGLCSDRLAILFAENRSLIADEIQNQIMSSTAGTPLNTSTEILAISQLQPSEKQVFAQMYELWAHEREGLFNYFKQFPDLFDAQPHIKESELKDPMAPYLLMKPKEGVTAKQVALETWCFGVETAMGSGNYIRFAVGAISEPTYARYAEAEAV